MKKKLNKKNYLTKKEKKYCRCLIHVRSKKIKNPYGICTNSVYNLQKKKRKKNIECSKNYDFDTFTLEELRLYAKEKNIPITKNNKYLSRKKLLGKIKYKQKKKYRK